MQKGVAVAGAKGSNLLALIGYKLAGSVLGGSTGAGLGYAVGGPVGAVVGNIAGGTFGTAIQAAREASIQNVDHLVTQAMLPMSLALRGIDVHIVHCEAALPLRRTFPP